MLYWSVVILAKRVVVSLDEARNESSGVIRDDSERYAGDVQKHIVMLIPTDAHNYEEFCDDRREQTGIHPWYVVRRSVPARTRSKKRPLLPPDVCRSTIRNIFLMYAYAVENRRKNWYTGAKHIKNSHF